MRGRVCLLVITLLIFSIIFIDNTRIYYNSNNDINNGFSRNEDVSVKERGGDVGFEEEYVITSREDFENGSYEGTIDTVTYPGNITLKKYSYSYVVGKSVSASHTLYEGYTIVPGDNAFLFKFDGKVTSVKIRVGQCFGMIKIKILRHTASGWICEGESEILTLTPNALNTFPVDIDVRANARLGVYIVKGYNGEITIASSNATTGYWGYDGDISTTPVTMHWYDYRLALTIEATVMATRYYSEGNWTSPPIEAKTIPNYVKIHWECYLQVGAALSVFIRNSVDGVVWSVWENIQNGSYYYPSARFLQLKVNLKSDGTHIPILSEIRLNLSYTIVLIINEFSSYGYNEWIEIVNLGYDVNLSGIMITDQDQYNYTLTSILLRKNEYYLLRTYGDFLDDYGDDILITYRGKTLDYISYASTNTASIDDPPSDYNFILDGAGLGGRVPAPGPNESAFLSPDAIKNNRASKWYIASERYVTPGAKNPYIIFVSVEDRAPSEVYPGDIIHLMNIRLRSNSYYNITMSGMKILLSGNFSPSEIEKISIYLDYDKNDTYSSSDILIYEGNFYSNILYINTNINLTSLETQTLLVYIKLSDNAIPTHYFIFSVVEVRGLSSLPIFETFSSTKQIMIRSRDYETPNIISIEFSDSPPLGKGTYYVRINFSEAMDVSILPVVRYYKKYGGSFQYSSYGMWVDRDTWEGKIEIMENFSSGNYILYVGEARDIAGNRMKEFYHEFYVDTDSPFVEDIYIEDYLGLGTHEIIINFSESMDVSKNIEVTISFTNITRRIFGTWKNNKCWHGVLEIAEKNLYAVGVIRAYGGIDLARNFMKNFSCNVIIDTVSAMLLNESWSEEPPLKDNSSVQIRIEFSEDIYHIEVIAFSKTDNKTFLLSILEIHRNEFVIKINTSEMDEGIYEIMLLNVTDIAGNTCSISLKRLLIIDKTPPSVRVLAPSEIPEGRNIEIYVYVRDSNGIDKVLLVYSVGQRSYEITMSMISDDTFKATIPGYLSGSRVYYKIYVMDLAGNSQVFEGIIDRRPSWVQYPVLWIVVALIYLLPFLFEFLMKKKK